MKTEPDPTGNENRHRFDLRRSWALTLIGLLVALLLLATYRLAFVRLTDFFFYEDHSYEDYQRGVDLYNRGAYDEVIRVLDESIRKRETHYAAMGRPSDAGMDIQLARNATLLGVALFRQGHRARAVECFTRAKDVYERTRVRWKDDPQIASELADTLNYLRGAQETLRTDGVGSVETR
jgi:tetratricopeptide (TPR) repeat protein